MLETASFINLASLCLPHPWILFAFFYNLITAVSSSTAVLSACSVPTWGLLKLIQGVSNSGRFISLSSVSNQWRGRFLQKVIQSNKISIMSPSLGLYTYIGCEGNLERLALLDCSYLLWISSSVLHSPVTSCPAVQARARATSVSADLLLLEALSVSITSCNDQAVLSSFWPSFPMYYLWFCNTLT